MEFTTEQKNKLGSAVADLKTYLHDVENCISEHRMQHIDFEKLNNLLKDVLCLCSHTETHTSDSLTKTAETTTQHIKSQKKHK